MESLSIQFQPFFEWLLRTTLQASLLICLILLLQAVLRSRLGVRWHYCLWLLLLVRMAMPWTPESRISLFNLLPQSMPQRQLEHAKGQIADSIAASANTSESTQVSTTTVAQRNPEATTVTPQPRKEAEGLAKSTFPKFVAMLPLAWLVGALVLAVYVCASNFNLLRIVKRQRPLTDQKILDLLEDCKSQMGIRTILGVVTTDKVKSPALFGFVRPRLLLPEGMIETLDQQELRYVLLHELAHLKRHDIYAGWLMSLLQVLHWFNPFVWLAFYRMRSDRELACDALVLARTQSDEPKSYGRIIVNLVERFSRPQRLPGMAGILETKAHLKRRITMIAKFKKNSYQWSPLAVFLIITLGCVSLPNAISTKTSQSSAQESSHSITLRKVWAGPGVDILGAPSPDGRYLSYVDWDTGDLAIREIATGKKRRLTNKGSWDESIEYAIFSRWSPDGKQIVYEWYNDKQFIDLYIIGLDGSKPRILYSNEGGEYAQTYDWSPDGRQILACFYRKDGTNQMVLFSAADGSVRVLKILEQGDPVNMSFSPDGRYIVYDFPQKEGSPERDISLLSTDGSREVSLVEHPANDYVLGWAPDGKNILFASDRTGILDGWVIQVADGKPQGVPELVKPNMIVRRFVTMGFTRDGSFYYGCQGGRIRDVYIAKLDPETGEILGPPKKVIKRFEGYNQSPDYSPDGKYLAYISTRGTFGMLLNRPRALCIRSLETGEEREFFPKIKRIDSPRWSPDCRSILVWGIGNKGRGIFQIDAQTGTVTPVVLSGETVYSGEWSHDGKAIFYVRSNDINNLRQILVRNLESGTEKELYRTSDDDRFHLSCSPDGKWLAFINSEKGVLRIMLAAGGEPRELYMCEQGDHLATPRWTPDGKYILFVIRQPESNLWRIPIEGGKPEKLGLDIVNLSVHPDGKHIAFYNSTSRLAEVWVMENFLPVREGNVK